MAKAMAAGPKINREDTDWGVRITLRPFPDPQYMGMEISADIGNPKPDRSPEIKVRFTGVPVQTPLRATDLVVWIAALRGMEEEARKIAAELKEGKPKKRPQKRKS